MWARWRSHSCAHWPASKGVQLVVVAHLLNNGGCQVDIKRNLESCKHVREGSPLAVVCMYALSMASVVSIYAVSAIYQPAHWKTPSP